jgi:Domain of unknown function (DUF4331)
MGHHFSTELARQHPQLDLTDVYAFESDQPGKTCLAMILNPRSKAGAADNFSPEALYKFHLGADPLQSQGLTFTIRFGEGSAHIGLLRESHDSLGLAGTPVGAAQLHEVQPLGDGLRFWAGTVKDPFFGNQNALTILRQSAAAGVLKLDAFKQHAGESPFTGITSSAIVLEVPNDQLPPTIHYFASVDWFDHGHWHRSNRVAHVLVPHLYLFDASDAQRAHRHEHLPAEDHQHHSLAIATIERYSRMAGFQGDPQAYARRLVQTLLPDAVPYRIGTPARYGVEGANGRKLSDDAMDTALSWVMGGPVSDEVSQPEGRVTQHFPFVVPVLP